MSGSFIYHQFVLKARAAHRAEAAYVDFSYYSGGCGCECGTLTVSFDAFVLQHVDSMLKGLHWTGGLASSRAHIEFIIIITSIAIMLVMFNAIFVIVIVAAERRPAVTMTGPVK